MNFELTDDQQEIKRTAHELLASRATAEKVRSAAEAGAYDDALWRELGELGWPGIAVSEEHGGQGLGIVERFASRSCAVRLISCWSSERVNRIDVLLSGRGGGRAPARRRCS